MSEPYRDAVCQRLTVRDLFLFRDVYEGLRAGRELKRIAEDLGVSLKVIRLMLKDVEEELRLPDGAAVSIREAAESPDADRLAPGLFHARIGRLLDDLTAVIQECRKGPRVLIQGSEFSVLSLLPRVLERSKFLEKHPSAVLDIRRARWPRFLANLEKGRIDLALGSPVPHGPAIDMTPLTSVRRAIIYKKDHRFACGKEAFEIRLEDLALETVFVLSGSPIPGFSMEKLFPPSQGRGRRIYLDSVSHMYHYVRRDLGVTIGYEPEYSPFPEDGKIEAKVLDEDKAAFCLFTRKTGKGPKLSEDAEALKQAILKTIEAKKQG